MFFVLFWAKIPQKYTKKFVLLKKIALFWSFWGYFGVFEDISPIISGDQKIVKKWLKNAKKHEKIMFPNFFRTFLV